MKTSNGKDDYPDGLQKTIKAGQLELTQKLQGLTTQMLAKDKLIKKLTATNDQLLKDQEKTAAKLHEKDERISELLAE